jgi:DNA-binding NarL/FixJ family response regulator
MKALVADHSATTRRVVIRALRVLGIQDVAEYADVGAAAAAPGNEYEVVVVEWSPSQDAALEFVSRLRQRAGAERTKVVVVSERDRRADIERAAAVGIQGYVLKPFETRVLIEQLAAAMQAGPGAPGNAEAA